MADFCYQLLANAPMADLLRIFFGALLFKQALQKKVLQRKRCFSKF